MVLLGSIVLAVVSCVGDGACRSPRATPSSLIVATISGVFVSGAFFMLYPPAARFYPTHIRSTGIGAAVCLSGVSATCSSPAAAGFMLQAVSRRRRVSTSWRRRWCFPAWRSWGSTGSPRPSEAVDAEALEEA